VNYAYFSIYAPKPYLGIIIMEVRR